MRNVLAIAAVLLAGLWPADSRALQQRLSVVFTHENSKFETLFTEFEQSTGIKVSPVWIDQSDLKARLLVVAETQNTPDVIFCPSDFLGLWDYIKLSEVPEALLTVPMSAANRNTAALNGKLYGVPITSGNHLLLYYNRALVPQAADTWENLKAQKAGLAEGKALISWSFGEVFWFVPFVTAFGEAPILAGKPQLATPAMQKGLSYVWDLARQGYVDAQCGYECAFARFVGGQSAYNINGIWSYQQYKDALGEKLGVALLPKLNGNTMRSYFSTIVAAFPHESLNREKSAAIKQLVAYVQQRRFQERLWHELHDVPVHQQVIEQIEREDPENVRVILQSLREAIPMPQEKNMMYIWESMQKGFDRYGGGAMDAEQATQFMQSLAERSMQR